jgi:cellulose synthase (UDP-forming)
VIRIFILRLVVVLTVILGVNYVAWRWMYSLNWDAWWIAVPLVLAETYSLIDVVLFGLTMWRSRPRPAPAAAAPGLTVDVFIATYNEPIDLVMATALAARDIRYPHSTWVLDDGGRPELKAAVENAGLAYLSRGAEWGSHERHAKAGNINNALSHTEGEFILILDADMIPRPEILDNTLGYFLDDKVALVQTPQIFSNVTESDPLGSQAPLFYGPIQQGKDGWNAAFFCGSNAILRRDALMQLGIADYVAQVEGSIGSALHEAARAVRSARTHSANTNPAVRSALLEVSSAIADARTALAEQKPLGELTYNLHRRVDLAASSIVAVDFASIQADLLEIQAMERVGRHAAPQPVLLLDEDAVNDALDTRELSPLNAIDEVQTALARIAIDRPDEAHPVMPLATISVTEDMATSMRLHSLGWKSVFHHELLADGLAPEDIGTMLTQRLRWGQGTMQVFLRENPLLLRGLNLAQRLMYFSTMWSYFSGFAALVYFAAPIIYLLFGILPVRSFAAEFFIHFLPFIAINQLLFLVGGRGIPTWRGQQYNLALFPVWIASCTTAFNNVVLRIPLRFAVTPKVRRENLRHQWHLVRPQLIVMALLIAATVVGLINLLVNDGDWLGTGVNVFWAFFDVLILSVVFGAVRYRGYVPRKGGS